MSRWTMQVSAPVIQAALAAKHEHLAQWLIGSFPHAALGLAPTVPTPAPVPVPVPPPAKRLTRSGEAAAKRAASADDAETPTMKRARRG